MTDPHEAIKQARHAGWREGMVQAAELADRRAAYWQRQANAQRAGSTARTQLSGRALATAELSKSIWEQIAKAGR